MSFDVAPHVAYVFILVFSRIGTMVMLMPALGEVSVSARVRLTFAVVLSVLMLPLVENAYAPMSSNMGGVSWAIISEIFVGLFVGGAARLIMSALQVAGTVIAFQTGLAFAQNVDPTQGVQSALFGSFLSILSVTMIFATDLHFLLIGAIRDSYVLFKPGEVLPLGDFVEMAVATVGGAFQLGVQIAAPFLVFGLIFYLALGILAKLMPQVQIFFVAMPANILLGFALFAVLMGALVTWFLTFFEQTMGRFLA
ncbi:MAG: flagellar biosynthetic protein FliR [Rhodobiaceae bacterium]|nr:MAG: flagellar biosynthetic protein FliR [Rhodobiaceae bacterium]